MATRAKRMVAAGWGAVCRTGSSKHQQFKAAREVGLADGEVKHVDNTVFVRPPLPSDFWEHLPLAIEAARILEKRRPLSFYDPGTGDKTIRFTGQWPKMPHNLTWQSPPCRSFSRTPNFAPAPAVLAPPPGFVISEIDYSALEVRMASALTARRPMQGRRTDMLILDEVDALRPHTGRMEMQIAPHETERLFKWFDQFMFKKP